MNDNIICLQICHLVLKVITGLMVKVFRFSAANGLPTNQFNAQQMNLIIGWQLEHWSLKVSVFIGTVCKLWNGQMVPTDAELTLYCWCSTTWILHSGSWMEASMCGYGTKLKCLYVFYFFILYFLRSKKVIWLLAASLSIKGINSTS